MPPTVSIVTPVYNGARFLEETAASVMVQTETDFEWILIDDDSSDDSAAVIRRLACSDSRIRVIFLDRNSGPAVARNAGLRIASGRYVAFLDCDDLWLPEKLEVQLSFMASAEAPVSFTAYRKIDEQGTPGGIVPVPEQVTYRALLRSNVIGMLTAMYDRDKLGTRYLPLIRKRQDYGLWLDILRDGLVARGLNRPLALYRVRSGSVSRDKLQAARYQWRVYRELEKLSVPESVWYFAHYAVRGFLKDRI